MYINSKIKTTALSIVASSLLIGCGSSSSNSPTDNTSSMKGVAIDGYVSGATVTLKNSSGAILATTKTLSNGDWSFSGVVIPAGAIVEVSGGTDISTGEVFEGVLKAPASTDGSEVVTTPLTTLVTALVQSGKSVNDAKSAVSNQLGIDIATLDSDPIEVLKTGTTAQKAKAAIALKKALVIQKTAETLSKSIGGSDAAFAAVMKSVAEKLNDGTNFDTVMNNTSAIVDIVKNDSTLSNIGNISEKLDAAKKSAQSVATMTLQMNTDDLTVGGANITDILEKKSKAMEVITSQIEKQIEKIALLNDLTAITTAGTDSDKSSNALIAMGGINGIQKTLTTQSSSLTAGEKIDASDFVASFLTDDIINTNAATYEKVSSTGITDLSDILDVLTQISDNTDGKSDFDIMKEFADANF